MQIESAELKFTVLIEKNENEGYTVTVPFLPGASPKVIHGMKQ